VTETTWVSRKTAHLFFMKVLNIIPFNYPEESYRGSVLTITGDPVPYTQTAGVFIDDLLAILWLAKSQGIKLKPVELNFELE